MSDNELFSLPVCEDNDNDCIYCDDYLLCSGTPCPEHPSYCFFKNDELITDMDEALYNGMQWGDILCKEDEVRLSNRTPDQVVADLRNKTNQRCKEIDGLRKYIIDKSIRQHCEPLASPSSKPVLKHKMRKMCENLTIKAEKLPDDSFYGKDGDCWSHMVGACPFMHTGEEELYTFPDHRPIKLVGGKQAKLFEINDKNVMWLSNKKPTPCFKAPPKIQDAW